MCSHDGYNGTFYKVRICLFVWVLRHTDTLYAIWRLSSHTAEDLRCLRALYQTWTGTWVGYCHPWYQATFQTLKEKKKICFLILSQHLSLIVLMNMPWWCQSPDCFGFFGSVRINGLCGSFLDFDSIVRLTPKCTVKFTTLWSMTPKCVWPQSAVY
jgi:hypothetical protein